MCLCIYGKTNISGKPSDELSREIIKYAIENNIKFFDTAREYGNSEQILSYVNKLTTNNTIITKLQKINYNTMKEDEIFIKIYESINTSCENLNIIVLPVLLLHNYAKLIHFYILIFLFCKVMKLI